MPELGEQMYCSEQICIPPAFPYLLRQFAKAAIRTQPTDLLRWSAGYFRCLSLNIPPPVKPRLEYPIPRDYCGITPGWLKALIYQLQNNITVPFKILWDRWTGACLEHDTLIKILCLGGFTDPEAIPLLRFIGLCASHLTDDLTHTMILICETMTEEPDGGSAMITVETFIDLYTFLGAIDASEPQILKNLYFTDSLLNLWKEADVKEEEGKEVKEESVVEEESTKTLLTEESEEGEVLVKSVSKDIISCPSIAGDDIYSMEYHVQEGEQEYEDGEQEEFLDITRYIGGDVGEEVIEGIEEEEMVQQVIKDMSEEEEEDKKSSLVEGEVEETSKEEPAEKLEERASEEVYVIESVDTVQEEPRRILPDVIEDDRMLAEDLMRLKVLQTEMAGESDTEVEKFKCRLIEEMPLTKSQEEAVLLFKDPSSKSVIASAGGGSATAPVEEAEEEEAEEEDEEAGKGEDIKIDKVYGIGPIVPEELVKAVCKYMKDVAALQHGMVMPRNIRHYNCPPLEVLEY